MCSISSEMDKSRVRSAAKSLQEINAKLSKEELTKRLKVKAYAKDANGLFCRHARFGESSKAGNLAHMARRLPTSSPRWTSSVIERT